MARDILFRGKNSAGSWVYGSLIQADEYCCILEDESKVHPKDWPYLDPFMGTFDGKATPVDPETIGQWTGAEDKNGDKIFEGDILDIDNSCVRTSLLFEVRFVDFAWNCVQPVKENFKHYRHRLERTPSKYEVISTIHDEPWLLGEKED